MLLNCGIGEVPWTARRSNQSILKISPEWSLEGLMMKLKLQYFGYLMWRTDSFEKTLMLGKTEGRRRRGWRGWDGWMASLTQWTWIWVNSGSWWWTGKPGMLQSMGLQKVRHDWVTELNWTALNREEQIWLHTRSVSFTFSFVLLLCFLFCFVCILPLHSIAFA